LAVVFLSIAAGAVFTVAVIIIKWLQSENVKQLSNGSVVSGIAAGMLIMYLTSILV
ncbi:MAG: divalent cation transporter, partial [Thaumarchaeota archaeon]|nr:divalent cation transporter [Nitrososphaerota archaeon]